MALIAQPFRHPDSGIYYLRRRVPDDLRQIIGKTEIRRSLNTRHHQQAKTAFALAYAESERLFNDARQGLYDDPSKQEVAAKPLPTPSVPTPTRSSIRLSETLARYVHSISLPDRSEYVSQRHVVDYSRAVNRSSQKWVTNPLQRSRRRTFMRSLQTSFSPQMPTLSHWRPHPRACCWRGCHQ